METLLPQQALAEWVRREYRTMEQAAASSDSRHWKRTTCRACGDAGIGQVFTLGCMPPANALLRPDQLTQTEPKFPLDLMLCSKCGMVQLAHVVPAELLFRSYLFFTSSSLRMVHHFSDLLSDNADLYVRPGGLIVELGSNDGTALASVRRRDVRVLGVDPARNVAVMAAARGVPTVSEFFTEALGCEIARVAGQASLVVACNVLGHIDDLDDVCRGIKHLLAPDGAMVFEVPYLRQLFEQCEYDTIYHEHLSYFAVRPLAALFNHHGLRLEKVESYAVHGGTIRGTVVHGEGVSASVAAIIEQEQQMGLAEPAAWSAMGQRANAARELLVRRLHELKGQGKRIVGYGAPAKGSVVLNFCGIGTDLVADVMDSTPAKQGLNVPGTHQRILAPGELRGLKPDVLLMLAWNHAPEILEHEQWFVDGGGLVLMPH